MSQYTHGWSNPPPFTPKSPQPPPQSPGAGASGGTWYAYCNITNGTWNVYNYLINTAGFSDAIVVSGPFATQQQAIDSAKAGCGKTSANPPPLQPGSPVPPTPPTPTGGAPSVSTYWNVCYDAGGGGAGIVQKLADTASGAMGQVGGAKAAFGPYSGILAAQAAADSDLQKCPNMPQPQPSCDVSALIDCAKLPAPLHALGIPGTKEWCEAIDYLVKEIGDIGTAVFKFIDDILNVKTRISNIDDYLAESGVAPVSNGILKIIRHVFCWIGPYLETMRQSITCARTWLATMFPKCNTNSLFGLLVIRHFLLSLERIEWGTDAAVWVVATSGIAIDPLMTTLDYLIRYACPVELVSEGEAVEAYKYNTVDEDIIRCVMAAHGKQLDAIKPYLEARGDKPNWREAIQYARRIGLSEDSVEPILRHLGVLNEGYRAALHELYDELPSIGDHLEWLRKNVFDEAYVKDFRLDEGFEDRFWARFGSDLRALGMKKENARLHYAAHWINPSFTQQFEMVQRLRPGRVDPSIQFSRDDLLRTMQEMDVGVYFRERLERISHPIPNLTLCLQMYQFGTVADGEFVEMLKDLGFDDANAGKILAAQVIKVRRLNASSGHGWTPTSLASAYAVGKLTPQQVSDEMLFLGYTQDASDRLMRRSEIELATAPIRRIQQQSIRSALATQEKAYKCGAISATQLVGVYTNAGIPERIGQIAAANVDSEVAVGLCGQQIATFRSALLKGKATVDQIRELMLSSGIPLLRVEQYLKGWVIEAQLKGPSATAAQILRWVGTGLLDIETASVRLLNLGWTDPDLTLLLAESSAKLSRYQQALLSKASKSQQAAAKAALALAREADATARKLRSSLRGVASITTLTKWFKDGLIDEATFTEYAEARGYPPEYTAKYLAEAVAARAKAKKPPAAKSTPGNPSNATP